MATRTDHVYFVPIGCSCINQFQLDFKFGKSGYDSQIFDWSIVTPDATIQFFESKGEGLVNSIKDISLYRDQIVRSEKVPGFYWWHMERVIESENGFRSIAEFAPHFEKFKGKTDYQVKKFFRMNYENVVFLWSNIQPNLKIACSEFFDDFVLTQDRYRRLKEVTNATFINSKIIFLVRQELVDSSLLGEHDIVKFNIPFSTVATGERNLYSPVWARFQNRGTSMPFPNLVAQSKYGPIIINCLDQFIGKAILQTGYWDEDRIELLRQLVEIKLRTKERVVFYDVGANIGTYSLALSKLFGKNIEIRAFEAQRMLCNMLCGTLALNYVENVGVHLNAVSQQSGVEMTFDPPDYAQENNFGGLELLKPYRSDNHSMRKSGKITSVTTVTIDEFSEVVDIIKIDIEGMEIYALNGAVATVNRYRPLVLVEIKKSKDEEIREFFLSKKYDLYSIGDDMLAVPEEMQITISRQS